MGTVCIGGQVLNIGEGVSCLNDSVNQKRLTSEKVTLS